MQQNADDAAREHEIAEPLHRPLPESHERHPGVLRQPVQVRFVSVRQHIDHVRAADALGVVHSRGGISVGLQLFGPRSGLRQHFLPGPEGDGIGGAGLRAGRLQPRADAVRAQRALIDLAGGRTDLRDIKRAPGHAELAADAVLLHEVDDPVGVLHDCARRRAGPQTPRVFAVHTLILGQRPEEPSVALRLVELDQLPEVVLQVRQRLVRPRGQGPDLVDSQVVPLLAGHLAGLTTDADGDVNQFGDFGNLLDPRGSPRRGRHRFHLQGRCADRWAHRLTPSRVSRGSLCTPDRRSSGPGPAGW